MVIEILQAYVSSIRADHRHQGRLVHNLRSALENAARSKWSKASTAQIVDYLAVLRDHLAVHFAREEEGGYLEEALVHSPELQPEANRLMDEHPHLLTQFDALLGTARAKAGEPAPWPALAKELNAVIRELVTHELDENKLLQDAFAADLYLDE